MKDIKEQVNVSSCYGKGWECDARECRLCEVQQKCKGICEKTIALKPVSPLQKTKAKAEKQMKDAPKQVVFGKATTADGLPNFKNMTLEQLELLAQERGANDSWKKYDNKAIRRMRVTMALKSTYTK